MKSTYFLLFCGSYFIVASSYCQITLTLQPGPEGKDAYINNYYSYGHGDYPNMFAISGTSSGVYFQSRSVIQFDLSAIPANVYILDARLSLYFANNPSNPSMHFGDNEALLQRIIEPWDEHTITFWNQPPTTTEGEVVLPQSTSPTQDYTDIDVLEPITEMYNDQDHNYGFLFRLVNESGERRLMFASGDYAVPSKRPKLVITYVTCPPPEVNFEYSADSLTVSFNGYSPSAITWHWDFGDGDTSDLQNPLHVYQEQGIYEVCLMVEDTCYYSEYCETLDLCTSPPVPNFAYSFSGLSVVFENMSTVATGYHWDFGDGDTSSLASPSHTYSAAGTYQVCLTAWNSCGTDVFCQVIDLCQAPFTSFYYYNGYDLEVQFFETCLMAQWFYWDFGDGSFSYYSNPLHTYEQQGDYLVCLTAYNDCGFETACDYIFLELADIKEDSQGTVMVYPNPASDHFTIRWEMKGVLDFELYNSQGQRLMYKQLDGNVGESWNINTGSFSGGIYFARFIGPGFYQLKKIIIVK